jgi:asparagine synthase (glutamine-hydrolysing)
MCGITGFYLPSQPLDEGALARMNDTLARRGPDDAGMFLEGPVGLAMRRLSIIDLGGGHQPIFNEDGSVVVVYNGEIYNYRELRTSLEQKGHRFRTHVDTEVIVHLYEDHGDDFAKHLQGMFAVALYDRKSRALHLARDRLGIKPLYLADVRGGLLFGSEIKALMASGLVSNKISPAALRGYLKYTFVPGNQSIYAGIRQLPPAGRLSIAEGGSRQTSFWSLPPPSTETLDPAELVQATEDKLTAAIKSHLVSDVPVGAFLSGGLDSGLIVALAAGRLGIKLRTFTVRFPSASGFMVDEVQTARALVDRYGLEHEVIDIEPDVVSVLPEAIRAFDEPFADDSIVPSFLVSEAAAKRVKVALTGLGGDELFAGYKRHLGVRLMESYRHVPAFLRKGLLQSAANAIPLDPAQHRWLEHLQRFTARTAGAPWDSYDAYMSSLDSEAIDALIRSPRAAAGERVDSIAAIFEDQDSDDLVDRALRTDLQAYLPNDILALTDRTSMWHSLELRVPFLDTGFVEWSAALPARYKLHGRTHKWMLRQIAKQWLPPVYLAQKKQGFESPMAQWLRGPLVPMWNDVLPPRGNEIWCLVDRARAQGLWEQHQARTRNNSKIVFSLLMLFLWHRKDRGTAATR